MYYFVSQRTRHTTDPLTYCGDDGDAEGEGPWEVPPRSGQGLGEVGVKAGPGQPPIRPHLVQHRLQEGRQVLTAHTAVVTCGRIWSSEINKEANK